MLLVWIWDTVNFVCSFSFVSLSAKASLSTISIPSVAFNASYPSNESLSPVGLSIAVPASSSTISLSLPSSLSTTNTVGVVCLVIE